MKIRKKHPEKLLTLAKTWKFSVLAWLTKRLKKTGQNVFHICIIQNISYHFLLFRTQTQSGSGAPPELTAMNRPPKHSLRFFPLHQLRNKYKHEMSNASQGFF